MRYVILILIGMLVGSLGTVAALNALRKANAFPHGVMAVMQYHLGSLRDRATGGQCDAEGSEPHLRTLLAVAGDIEPALLPTGGDDDLFRQYASQYRERIATALASPPIECRTLTETVGSIGDGCKACHRDFR